MGSGQLASAGDPFPLPVDAAGARHVGYATAVDVEIDERGMAIDLNPALSRVLGPAARDTLRV